MSVDVDITSPGCCMSHNHQFTYNYTPALREAGFPSWSMLDQLPANVVMTMVTKVIKKISEDWPRYNELIRGGGEWGTSKTLLEQLRALELDLGKHYDDGTVRCG